MEASENLLCMICCLSYKPPRTKSGQVEEDDRNLDIIEAVSQFGEQVLKAGQDRESPKDEAGMVDADLNQSQSSNDNKNGVKTHRRRGGRKRKKKDLDQLMEMEDSVVISGEGGDGKVPMTIEAKITAILESCKPDNISICSDCVANMKNATSAKAQATQMEIRVRELQLQLLSELRALQCQMNSFYAAMEIIEDSIENTDSSCLDAILKFQGQKKNKKVRATWGKYPVNRFTIRRERVLRLRRQISDVSRDLQRYRSEMVEKFEDVRVRDKDEEHPYQSINIKVENEVDFSFDYDDYTATEEGFDFKVNTADLYGAVVPGTSTSNANTGSVEAGGPMGAPAEENSSGPDDDDQDEDYQPVPSAKMKKKRMPIPGERITPFGRVCSDMDFLLGNLPEFKRNVAKRVLTKQHHNFNYRSKKLKQERTPFQKHMLELEYHVEKKVIILSGIQIYILDKEENPNVENGLKCSKCSFQVSADADKMELAMYDHILSKHLEVYVCPTCDAKLESDHEYRKHIIQCRDSKIKCEVCGKPLGCNRALKVHSWLHMNEEEKAEALANGFKPQVYRKDLERNLQCSTCGKWFRLPCELRNHQIVHKSREEREQNICPYCGKTYLDAGWNYHKNYSDCAAAFKEADLVPVQCQICNKTIKNKIILKQHIKHQHSEEGQLKPFVCAQCGKAFKYKGNLVLHEHTHTGVKRHKCSGCGVAYTSSSNLSRHLKKCESFAVGSNQNNTGVNDEINHQQNQVPPQNANVETSSYYSSYYTNEIL